MKTYIIYDHISPSGKHYIGQTSNNPERRWRSGKGYLQKHFDRYTQPLFAYAILKYGWDSFEHKIVHTTTSKSECDYTEKYLIRWYKSQGMSYNISAGGTISYGEQTTSEMSEYQNNNKKSINQYTLDGKFIKTWEGIRPAARELKITKTGITSVLSGRKPTSFGFMWRYNNGNTEDIDPVLYKHKPFRSVEQYTIEGELVSVWKTMQDAGNTLGISASCISEVCKGKRKTAGGYKWKYIE